MVRINPVKATCQKYKGNCEIANINNTCYEICAAFSGTTDPYNMDPQCTKSCDDFIEQEKIRRYGVGNCDRQSPYKPVIWNQIPNYVPELIKNGASPEQALQQGMQRCSQYLPNLVQECQDRCRLHYSAIEPYSSMGFDLQDGEKGDNGKNGKNGKKPSTIKVVLFYALICIVLIFLFSIFFIFANSKQK